MVEPPEEDGYPASMRRPTSVIEWGSEQEPNAGLYVAYKYPEAGQYTKAFSKVEGERKAWRVRRSSRSSGQINGFGAQQTVCRT